MGITRPSGCTETGTETGSACDYHYDSAVAATTTGSTTTTDSTTTTVPVPACRLPFPFPFPVYRWPLAVPDGRLPLASLPLSRLRTRLSRRHRPARSTRRARDLARIAGARTRRTSKLLDVLRAAQGVALVALELFANCHWSSGNRLLSRSRWSCAAGSERYKPALLIFGGRESPAHFDVDPVARVLAVVSLQGRQPPSLGRRTSVYSR